MKNVTALDNFSLQLLSHRRSWLKLLFRWRLVCLLRGLHRRSPNQVVFGVDKLVTGCGWETGGCCVLIFFLWLLDSEDGQGVLDYLDMSSSLIHISLIVLVLSSVYLLRFDGDIFEASSWRRLWYSLWDPSWRLLWFSQLRNRARPCNDTCDIPGSRYLSFMRMPFNHLL